MISDKIIDINESSEVCTFARDDNGDVDVATLLECPLLLSLSIMPTVTSSTDMITVSSMPLSGEHEFWKSVMSPREECGSLYAYIPVTYFNRYWGIYKCNVHSLII